MFRFFSSSAIIILFAFPVSAKETNLKSTLEATYNNNYLIAQQREKILKYNESVTQQLSVKKPDLSANLSQNLDESNGKYNNSANITIKQLLYDGGQSSNLVDAAKYTVLAERELLIKAEQDNLLKAITVYMDLRQAQANLELAENNIKEPFLLLNGDTYFDVSVKELYEFHSKKGSNFTFSVFKSNNTSRYLGLNVDSNMKIVSSNLIKD
mgnify:CR=1 FL=1